MPLHVAERLRQAVEQLDIPHPGSPAGHVTISLGVAAVEELTPETLPPAPGDRRQCPVPRQGARTQQGPSCRRGREKSACLAADDRL